MKNSLSLMALAVTTLLAACASQAPSTSTSTAASASTSSAASTASPAAGASAILKPTQGNTVSGAVSFTQRDGVVWVQANINGLTPGLHGFHIHEKGDCSAPDGTSAGGHFNPNNHEHGPSYASGGHAGDMGNLNADSTGHAQLKMPLAGVELNTAADGIIGRAVIVHLQVDDLHSQPVGNAGARVACGVIAAR